MFGPPAFPETKVAVTERAGERNLTDIGQAARRSIERRRIGFQRHERTRHLAGLMFEPFWLVMLDRAPTRLIDGEDRGIENAVGKRLQAQRGKARPRLARHDPAGAGAFVKKFEDDARV